MPATPRSARAPGAGTTVKLNDAPCWLLRVLDSQYVPALSVVVKVPIEDPFEDPQFPTVHPVAGVIGELQLFWSLYVPPLYLPKRRVVDPLQFRVICCVPVTVKDLSVST